jgi:hypothetical protein
MIGSVGMGMMSPSMGVKRAGSGAATATAARVATRRRASMVVWVDPTGPRANEQLTLFQSLPDMPKRTRRPACSQRVTK